MRGEAALTRLLVNRREIVAGLFHYLYDLIEAHGVASVGEGRLEAGVHGANGGVGVAFDAGDLHKATHGVASHAQMVL